MAGVGEALQVRSDLSQHHVCHPALDARDRAEEIEGRRVGLQATSDLGGELGDRLALRAGLVDLVKASITGSILGNLLLMRLLVGGTHLRPTFGNMISIAVCSLANFLVSDRWVFRTTVRAQ